MDDFLKNVGSSEESIRMQDNVMVDVATSEMEWNEPLIRDCFVGVCRHGLAGGAGACRHGLPLQ